MTQTDQPIRGRFALAALACLGTAPALAQDAKPLLEEGFRDDYTEARLDERFWYISDGWTNGEWQDCEWSREMVALEDGMLRLTHRPADEAAGTPPLCGEVQTRDFIQYGTIEARIRTPRASGLNASVFTYAGEVHDSPHDEIDIEILTRAPDEVALNTYVAGQQENGRTVPISPPLDEAFHTVAMRWEPDRIIWYIDGREVHRTAPDTPLPDHPQKIYMSFWSTTQLTDWMGVQEPRTGDLTYELDWLAYTPLTQSCLFEGSVTC